MKQSIVILLTAILYFTLQSSGEPKIKVACIGDSITDGDGLQDRTKEAYPAILSAILGEDYEVLNFGKSGATMMKNGDWPYWAKPAFGEALAFNPAIVIIKLGSNDAKPQNIPAHRGEYIEDLRAMVDTFSTLPSRPRIYLCKPVPAFENRFHIIDSLLCSDVLPAIDIVAAEKDCRVIDLYTEFSDKQFYFPDGVHPDKAGAAAIAEYIANKIK
jgi:lysophospholipase L1-like esterase